MNSGLLLLWLSVVSLPAAAAESDPLESVKAAIVQSVTMDGTLGGIQDPARAKSLIADELALAALPASRPSELEVMSMAASEPLVLVSADEAYCRAKARHRLLGVMVVAHAARSMPRLAPEDLQRTTERIDRLFADLSAQLEVDCGHLVQQGMIEQYARAIRRRVQREMVTPWSPVGKKALTDEQCAEMQLAIDAYCRERDAAIRQLVEDASRGSVPGLPIARLDSYAQHEIVFSPLSYLEAVIISRISVPPPRLDDQVLVAAYESAVAEAASREQEQVRSLARIRWASRKAARTGSRSMDPLGP